jgi:hypothetical protein
LFHQARGENPTAPSGRALVDVHDRPSVHTRSYEPPAMPPIALTPLPSRRNQWRLFGILLGAVAVLGALNFYVWVDRRTLPPGGTPEAPAALSFDGDANRLKNTIVVPTWNGRCQMANPLSGARRWQWPGTKSRKPYRSNHWRWKGRSRFAVS